MLLNSMTNQPSLISLFSSTSSNPTLLARVETAKGSNESFVSLIHDATDGRETLLAWNGSSQADLEARSASLAAQRDSGGKGLQHVCGHVLHLQAPDCRTTYIRFGSLDRGKWKEDGLGVELPVVHFQLKELGQEMYVDVAVVDDEDEMTVVRCSTWQPKVEFLPATDDHPRLLHFPLRFPSPTSSTPLLTHWSTVSLPLHTLISPSRLRSIVGVEVHATCRLRRIWFSEVGMPGEVDEEMARRGMRLELALYEARRGEVR
ncbi:proteophosphoglycan 5 [Rhodotorula toruloides]|uniref:Proteophosphoglycan 5 n=1 Tax=Rhodotorula toruloides TaxID=5286 RepID=A0A511KA53_RHOTO|nr:proteophosphoglycan 5 [Rhodotorula toruloides]